MRTSTQHQLAHPPVADTKLSDRESALPREIQRGGRDGGNGGGAGVGDEGRWKKGKRVEVRLICREDGDGGCGGGPPGGAAAAGAGAGAETIHSEPVRGDV